MPKNRTISSQAPQECGEGSTHRPWSPDRTVKAHERTASKVCSKCGEEKDASNFEGGRNTCRLCRFRIYYDKDKRRIADAKSYQARREKILAQKAVYHKEKYESLIKPYKSEYNQRPEVIAGKKLYNSAYGKRHYEQNKALYLAKFLKRRAAKMRALPVWADLEKINQIYEEARVKSESGIKYEVDHIVPLQSELVCGLHVHYNLRVITKEENRKKRNKLLDDIC